MTWSTAGVQTVSITFVDLTVPTVITQTFSFTRS